MTIEERLAELERRQKLLYDKIRVLLANGYDDNEFSDDYGHAYMTVIKETLACLESGWEKKP